MTCGHLEFQDFLKVSCNSGLKFSHCNWSWETSRHLGQALPPCFRANSLHAFLPAWLHQTVESDSWSNTSSLCKLKKKKRTKLKSSKSHWVVGSHLLIDHFCQRRVWKIISLYHQIYAVIWHLLCFLFTLVPTYFIH